MKNNYAREQFIQSTIDNFLQGMLIIFIFTFVGITVLSVIWLLSNNHIVFAVLAITAFVLVVSAAFAYYD